MGVVGLSVVAVVDVCVVGVVVEVVVIEVAGVEVSAEVVISVVAVVTVVVGGVGVDVAVEMGVEVIKVETGVVFGVDVAVGCVVEREVEVGRSLVVDVKGLVVTGTEVLDVGELTVSVGVIEDVAGGVGVIFVVRDSVEVSLVGFGVVFPVDVA